MQALLMEIQPSFLYEIQQCFLNLKNCNLSKPSFLLEALEQKHLIKAIEVGYIKDGTQVQIKSVKLGKYLSAENGGGTSVVCNRNSASGWETFRLWRITETNFQFRVFNEQFMGLNGNNVVAVVNPATASETFQIIRSNGDRNRVHLKAPNGAIPEDFGELSKLETLELSGNPFATLPDSIGGLSRLKRLRLESCLTLISIPELPSSLIEINANKCRSMRRLPNLSNLSNLQELHLSNCDTLMAIDGIEGLESLRGLYMSGCVSFIKRNLLQEVFEHLSYFTFPAFPGTEIPE